MATSNDNTIPGQYMGPVIFSRTLGTAIEWYDFFPYGTIPVRLFSKPDPLVGPLLSLFTFLAGFVARPFGGAHFGHLGDRSGRKSPLIATLLLMGLSTLFIGVLPNYATLGLWPQAPSWFWASWPQMSVPIGLGSSSADR